MGNIPYRVLITASGTGSALGDLTKYTNKTLIKVGRRPTLSYIIDLYPKNTEFVVTLGHFSEFVKEFIKVSYPQSKITFVNVDNFDRPGSSLLYSMLKAEKHLRSPFIFHASDTIIYDLPPVPKNNWIVGCEGVGSSNYCSFDVVGDLVKTMHDKGHPSADFLHTGVVGISDHKSFWKLAKEINKSGKENPSDVDVVRKMLDSGNEFRTINIKKWHDVGNLERLNQARSAVDDSFHILDKPSESIYFLKGKVVKFFSNPDHVRDRVKRAAILKNLTPKIISTGRNFYAYEYVDGELMANIANRNNLKELLAWAEKKLWIKSDETTNENFKKVCLKFYKEKTYERLNEFLVSRKIKDKETLINGELVPPAKKMLDLVNFEKLASGEQSMFHGDFILDNILKTPKGFCLLDWRQNFGGLLKSGDKYYDLAKLNHNLVINHDIVNNKLFTINITPDSITCDINRRETLVECQETFWEYVKKHDLDENKIRLLTPIAWLNMSSLHEHPYDLFLYYFGRYKLWEAIKRTTTDD